MDMLCRVFMVKEYGSLRFYWHNNLERKLKSKYFVLISDISNSFITVAMHPVFQNVHQIQMVRHHF